ncbi:hypothetical protein ColTof4_11457 [Colletotrichum tofieldiae]|nr:hypothetical protein ColTof4_11457 [Colletotrichum tofieldiae]
MYTGQEATVESEVEKNNTRSGTAAVAPAAAGGIPPTNPPGSSIGRRRLQTENLARTAPTRRIRAAQTSPPPPYQAPRSPVGFAPLDRSATRGRCTVLPNLPDAAVRDEDDREAQASGLLLKRALGPGKGKKIRRQSFHRGPVWKESVCARGRQQTFNLFFAYPEV